MTRKNMNEVPWATRLTGAVLALGVTVAHIADQGGVTEFNGTADWLGWAYRLIEVGGVATALVLVLAGGWRLAWAPAVLLAVGAALGFLASRTVGVPGDSGDRGNWAWDVGALSLVVEVSLLLISLGVLLSRQSQQSRPASPRPAHRNPCAEPSIAPMSGTYIGAE
jgi:hypothetical protein